MSFLKRDEKKRLVAELIDDLLTGPNPTEEYDSFMLIDMVTVEALLFGILYVIANTRDIATASLSFTGIMFILFVYTYFKSIKRHDAVAGKMFLESTTYIGDSDLAEQIEVVGWELLVVPKERMTKDRLVYEKDDLLETLTALEQPGVMVGSGPINAPIVEELANVKAERYIDEFKRKQAEENAERKGIFKKKKPKSDVSYIEDETDDIIQIVQNMKFKFLDDDEEDDYDD